MYHKDINSSGLRSPNDFLRQIVFESGQQFVTRRIFKIPLSYDVASGSVITPCNKIDKPLVVYSFTGNVMTSITTFHT